MKRSYVRHVINCCFLLMAKDFRNQLHFILQLITNILSTYLLYSLSLSLPPPAYLLFTFYNGEFYEFDYNLFYFCLFTTFLHKFRQNYCLYFLNIYIQDIWNNYGRWERLVKWTFLYLKDKYIFVVAANVSTSYKIINYTLYFVFWSFCAFTFLTNYIDVQLYIEEEENVPKKWNHSNFFFLFFSRTSLFPSLWNH